MAEEIKAVLDDFVNSGKALGVGYIALDRSGNHIYAAAHGKRRFSSDEPLTLETPGFLASASKLMTSVAAMQLVERGLIGLDDDLSSILPWLGDLEILLAFDEETKMPTFEKPTNKVTLRRLLSHSSGFAYSWASEALLKWTIANGGSEGDGLAGEFKNYQRPMISNPNTKWSYSPGVDFAGRVIETITKQSLEDYMHENIWAKLRMNATTFHPEIREDPYVQMEMGMRLNGSEAPLTPGKSPYACPAKDDCGGAGIYSSANDYSKFLAALLSDNGPILKKESLDEFTKAQLSPSSAEHLNQLRHVDSYQPDIPLTTRVDHSLGGLRVEEDILGRRKAGSIAWDGMVNPTWMLDRKSGIAIFIFTQILPQVDMATKRLHEKLETIVYKQLGN